MALHIPVCTLCYAPRRKLSSVSSIIVVSPSATIRFTAGFASPANESGVSAQLLTKPSLVPILRCSSALSYCFYDARERAVYIRLMSLPILTRVCHYALHSLHCGTMVCSWSLLRLPGFQLAISCHIVTLQASRMVRAHLVSRLEIEIFPNMSNKWSCSQV